MDKYLFGYSTEDTDLESEIQTWINGCLVYNFDDKLYIVKPGNGTEFINGIRVMFENRGKFFLTRWREPVTYEPRNLFPAPDKDA